MFIPHPTPPTPLTTIQIPVLSKIQLPIWLAYILIYSLVPSMPVSGITNKLIKRDWADFNIPAPFTTRVRNALKAEACSVRLSNLVGAGGSWYGFGKIIMDM
jgi:GINS complex subunit 3